MADIGRKGPGNLGSGKGEVQTGSPSAGTSVLVKDRVKEKVEEKVSNTERTWSTLVVLLHFVIEQMESAA
jgi:hypothetical protein